MIWYLLPIAGGAGLALQAGTNGTLSRFVGGPLAAALVNFIVGGAALVVLAALVHTRPDGAMLRDAPAWSWIGGLLGALFIAGMAGSAPRIGAGIAVALALGAQLVAAVALDHFGIAGFRPHPLSPGRVMGVVLILGGVIAIAREP